MSGLSARDIGHRVVVRHALGGGQLTDVIGVLQSLDAETLAVRHADSTVHRVRLTDVAAAKPIPPMPLRPVDVDQLFLTTALGRPAAETRYVGQWLLRASAGWTGRGNSLLPAGDPGMPVVDALKHTRAFYEERDLPALALVRLGSAQEEEFRRLGWIEARPDEADVRVMHTTLDLVNGEPAYEVAVTDRPDADWYAAASDAPLPAVAATVMEGAPKSVFASIALDGRTVAVARGAMTGHWVAVDAVRVDPRYRRRGLGTALLQGITRWAGPLGGRRAYLEVVEDNAAAMATYTRLGYDTAYKYRYLTVQ
ncbi:acetyltransferase (GNAT) family protein [Kribbella amoyensis]|uniref:Acetyltransferase (GNAT) family protein n=1 Tax=Kribbella amoyensis TaxID=996641 RepID=A0A561B352_9ACTN|nr:GNAT family N-acetyltransferase [Kribbella amoyensis]TWD73300.1 acetyltransferase (GNAT) family protein [Kribbella amoyensis]